ncbi:MAG: hypothetical protein RSC33_06765, partial [Vagococcus sp.]
MESQEATYQEKQQEMTKLTKEIEQIETEKNYQSELEKTVLEQQKRFPMYIEWETLNREFSRETTVSATELVAIKEELANYEFLLRKEKELLESQTGYLETESPAYQFY